MSISPTDILRSQINNQSNVILKEYLFMTCFMTVCYWNNSTCCRPSLSSDFLYVNSFFISRPHFLPLYSFPSPLLLPCVSCSTDAHQVNGLHWLFKQLLCTCRLYQHLIRWFQFGTTNSDPSPPPAPTALLSSNECTPASSLGDTDASLFLSFWTPFTDVTVSENQLVVWMQYYWRRRLPISSPKEILIVGGEKRF